jgi:cytoskeletal protein RodZ
LVERGARLRERRVSHGITQQQVGEALWVPVEGSVPYSITLVV